MIGHNSILINKKKLPQTNEAAFIFLKIELLFSKCVAKCCTTK
jgi:hypothetical protein